MKAREILCCIFGLLLLFPSAFPQGEKKGGGLGIQVVLSEREPFSIPATGKIFGIVPVSGKGNVSALRIIPEPEGEAITIRLSPLFGGVEKTLPCEQLWMVRSDPVITRVGREGETIRIADFEHLGIAPFELRIIRLSASDVPDVASLQGCCECGKLVCCPNPAQRIGCGSCGPCCLRP